MHGRLKVKTTAEQQEAKRKEREKKLKVYNAAVQKVFAKRKVQEYDEEALHISGEILAANSDFYTLWNFRKETFLHFKTEKSDEELQELFQQELYFLQSCLKGNPKSYGTWHHRCFVLDNIPKPDWERELQLCNRFLEYDERNFHCWDYRKFVVTKSQVSLQSEFEFTTKKISSNFSNYSSWHYRSKLLPVISPDPSQPSGVQEEQVLQEHEAVQNAYFTDPDDQSAWFYHRWLLGRGEKCQQILQMFASRKTKRVIVLLNKAVQVGVGEDLLLGVNSAGVECVWRNQMRKQSYSTLWIASDVSIPDGEVKVRVSIAETDWSAELTIGHSQDSHSQCFGLVERSFRSDLSAATSDVLRRELDGVQELFSLEPENKWVLLTVVLLMKALSQVLYKDQILDHLQHLQEIDPKRRNYYLDLRSKMLIENMMQGLHGQLTDVNLANQNLSCMAHLELLALSKDLQLQNNSLRALHNFQYLQCMEKLNVRGNKLMSCDGIDHLPELAEIDLAENSISSTEGLTVLSTCPKLRVLHLAGNPVCDDSGLLQRIRDMLPAVTIHV